jgi:hypothetical protein
VTTRVHTDLEAYRVAVSELPVSATPARDLPAAVAVVRGEGRWWERASAAVRAGAGGIVVAQPGAAPSAELHALARVAAGTPVVVERRLLRPGMRDLVDASAAGHPPWHAVVVECHAPASALRDVLPDAIGWARVVAGTPLTCRISRTWEGGTLALLDPAEGGAISLTATVQPGAPAHGRLRVTAIGQERVEVDADLDTVVSIADAAGRRILPPLLESPERVALRRAIAAVRTGEVPLDLDELRHDTALAEELLTASIHKHR